LRVQWTQAGLAGAELSWKLSVEAIRAAHHDAAVLVWWV
jgi:hypothetical protein